jgi:hypothetical protein
MENEPAFRPGRLPNDRQPHGFLAGGPAVTRREIFPCAIIREERSPEILTNPGEKDENAEISSAVEIDVDRR